MKTPRNNSPKDVSLFERFADPDAMHAVGEMVYMHSKGLSNHQQDACNRILAIITFLQQLAIGAVDSDKDPFWPRFGNQLVDELVETRQLENDEEYAVVWRNYIIAYYKHPNRCPYINELPVAWEITQFQQELTMAVLKHILKHDPDDQLGLLKLVQA